MAAAKREGQRTVTVQVPEELAQRLEELLRQTGRTLNAEVALALEFWLDRQGLGESAVESDKKAVPRPSSPP